MEILVEYGIRPHTECLIHKYLEGLVMLSRAGHYYGAPFMGSMGFTQGNLIPPTIFNMVVDAFIHHWVTVVDG